MAGGKNGDPPPQGTRSEPEQNFPQILSLSSAEKNPRLHDASHTLALTKLKLTDTKALAGASSRCYSGKGIRPRAYGERRTLPGYHAALIRIIPSITKRIDGFKYREIHHGTELKGT